MKNQAMLSLLLSLFFGVTVIISVQLQAAPGNNGNGSTPNGQPFKHLQEQIDQTNADLDALAASTGVSIASLEADVAAAQLDINNLQSQINNNDADILALSNDTAANAAAIAVLEADTAQLQSDLATLEAEVATKQDVLTGGCASGSSLRVIFPNGSFICEFDDTDTKQSRLVIFGPFVNVSGSYAVQSSSFSGKCPSDHFVASGGHSLQLTGNNRNVNVSESRISSNGWLIRFSRAYINSFNRVRAEALCLKIFN